MSRIAVELKPTSHHRPRSEDMFSSWASGTDWAWNGRVVVRRAVVVVSTVLGAPSFFSHAALLHFIPQYVTGVNICPKNLKLSIGQYGALWNCFSVSTIVGPPLFFSLTDSSTLSHYVRPTVIVYMYASMRNIYAFQWALSSEHLWFFSHAALLTSTPQPTSKIWDVVSVNLLATSLSAFNSPRERSFSISLKIKGQICQIMLLTQSGLKTRVGFSII